MSAIFVQLEKRKHETLHGWWRSLCRFSRQRKRRWSKANHSLVVIVRLFIGPVPISREPWNWRVKCNMDGRQCLSRLQMEEGANFIENVLILDGFQLSILWRFACGLVVSSWIISGERLSCWCLSCAWKWSFEWKFITSSAEGWLWRCLLLLSTLK